MERAQRLASFWSWLPAFRAVAETQHLPTAARVAHVTPSSLSRSIRLLEEELGVPLFDRVGRSIELNEAGRVFLDAVRDAMRLVDDGLAIIGGGELLGPVHISVPGPFAPIFVLPAMETLGDEHPDLVPHLSSVPDGQLAARLLAGVIDVALTDDPSPSKAITVEVMGRLTHSVYCGPSHPLRHAPGPTRAQVLAHPFVAPPADERGRPADAWRTSWKRRIGLSVDQMQAAVEACSTGRLLCALPDVVARRYGLTEVPFDRLPSTTLHLAYRRPLPLTGRMEVVLQTLRSRAAAVLSQKPSDPG